MTTTTLRELKASLPNDLWTRVAVSLTEKALDAAAACGADSTDKASMREAAERIAALMTHFARRDETYTDLDGNVWTRPTAEAYAIVCKNLDARPTAEDVTQATVRDWTAEDWCELFERAPEVVTLVRPQMLPRLNDDLRHILGMPNFTCGGMAQVMRNSGRYAIVRKSEHEQAAVIYFLLTEYLADPTNWRVVAQEKLIAMSKDDSK